MKIGIDFIKLNTNWDIDHGRPDFQWKIVGPDIKLSFRLDHWKHRRFAMDDRAMLRFRNASFHRHGAPSQRDWQYGKCRYGRRGMEWGNFYEVMGQDEKKFWPKDWWRTKTASTFKRHFLIHLPDATFECIADGWVSEPLEKNALFKRPDGNVPDYVNNPVSDETAEPETPGWRNRMSSLLHKAMHPRSGP